MRRGGLTENELHWVRSDVIRKFAIALLLAPKELISQFVLQIQSSRWKRVRERRRSCSSVVQAEGYTLAKGGQIASQIDLYAWQLGRLTDRLALTGRLTPNTGQTSERWLLYVISRNFWTNSFLLIGRRTACAWMWVMYFYYLLNSVVVTHLKTKSNSKQSREYSLMSKTSPKMFVQCRKCKENCKTVMSVL